MNKYTKLQEPFAFWLVKQCLPVEEDQEEHARPISNREFYSAIGILLVALVALNIIFHGLPF